MTYRNQLILLLLAILYAANASAQVLYQPNKELVKGGQFKDLFLPIPFIDKLTDENLWGADGVLPRDASNGVEDNVWSYWGGNPIKDKDGLYHIAICRWKEETGHWGWPNSEVAHAVSKHPMGPYSVTATIIEKGHNPEVIQLNDGSYILHISGAKIYAAKQLTGPWEFVGKLEIDTRGYKGLSHLNTNLTGLQRKDGSFLFFTKRGDVMLSNTGILGPFKIVSAHNYNRYTGYPEDPVIWKSRHQYHVVYNHAVEKKSRHMRSIDGINWITEPGLAYDKDLFTYEDGQKNSWTKFERPKVIQDEYGRATHLTLGVIDVEKKLDLGNDKHSSKHIVLPLQTERLIEIISPGSIHSETKEVSIRIKAEKDFRPNEEIDITSLRIGPSNLVNIGKGATAIRSSTDKDDLIVDFTWNNISVPSGAYDLKLLGETKSKSLVYAYALLPGQKEDPACLVTLPITITGEIGSRSVNSAVENFGLQTSSPVTLQLIEYSNQKRKVLKKMKVPALKPYETFAFEVPVGEKSNAEYEVVLIGTEKEINFWNKVDDSDYTVVYKGEWSTNRQGKNMYMGSEQVASTKRASASFFFTGTQAQCYGNISKQMGSCDVFIDDAYMETVDCFFGADIHNTVIYQTPVLPDGLHKLEIRVRDEHYKGNEKGPVAIDAFSYR